MKAAPSSDGQDQAVFQALAVAFQQRVMRPGDGRARGQQDQRVEQRQMPGIEGLDALRRPDAGTLQAPIAVPAAAEQRVAVAWTASAGTARR